MKTIRNNSRIIIALFIAFLSAWLPGARAIDWTGTTGYWNDPANWGGTVPDNTGGWAIGNIGNGGTGIISNTVPHVSEAWAGNGGIAGNIIVTNGGTFAVDNWLVVGRTGGGGNTPLSTLTVGTGGVINKTGDGFILGDGGNCLGQMFVTGNGIVNVTGGWNGIGNGSGGEGWLTLQDNAVYNVTGRDWNIGDYGSGKGHAYIKDNATLNVNRFWIGKADTSVGAVWQTGGAIHGSSGGNDWCIGGENNASTASSGFYSLAGGSLDNVNNFQIGRYGKGIIYQSGGTLTTASWTSFGRFTGSIGVMWLTGGSFSHTGTGPQLFVAEEGRGEFTIANAGVLNCNLKLRMGNAGGYGIFNLNGGTTSVPGIEQTGGTGYVNFNGGTLKATAISPTFMTGLAEACVFSGNAVVDTAGFDVTVAQPLVAPVGDGVLSITVTDGGTGYMAPPIVQIDPSSGSGATAVAEIDIALGKVTNIVVTCSGYNYGGAPAVTLIGGGAVTAATATANVGAVASGGLTKNGNGTLTLTGVNTYTGNTVVNAGKLALNATSIIGSGNYSVANGAELDVTLLAVGVQLTNANLTLATTTAATLGFDLGSFGNQADAALTVSNLLTVNGTITVNIVDGLPQIGQIPLLKYGSKTGTGSFVLGTLPTGVAATLVNNTGNKSIDLLITSVGLPRWDGQVAGALWDINTTTNWIELSTGLPTFYKDGAPALFNDFALGSTTVNLNITVLPASVTVNNSTNNYILQGTGKISGPISVTKQGSATLTVANVNDYTGPTVIQGGLLSVTNLPNGGLASPIGQSSSAATNLILAGGALSYAGPATTSDRGYSVQGANGGIDAQSNLTLTGPVSATTGGSFIKTGPAQLTYLGAGMRELSGGGGPGYRINNGTVLFDGNSGAQTNHNQNDMWVGSATNASASLVLSNTTLNIDSWLAIGRGNGDLGYSSSVALYNSKLTSGNFSMGYDNGLVNVVTPTLTLNGNSTFTNNGDVNVGESTGSTATILLKDTSALYSNWRVHLGWHAGGIANMTLADSSTMRVFAWFSIGHEGGTGTLTLKDNSSTWIRWDMNITDVATGTGELNVQNNAQLAFGSCFVGKGVGSSGTVNQTGGSVLGRDDGNEMHVGFHGVGTYNLSGGTLTLSNHWFVVGRWSDGPGVFNLTGGSVIHNTTGKRVQIGEDGTGILNVSGTGSLSTIGNELAIGLNATGNGTVNLDGGSITARRVIGINGTSLFNFNGGVLRAGPNAQADFMSGIGTANVLVGGAKIDTGTNNVNIAQSLLDGDTLGGGLTKTGNGTLRLNGANTYTGKTTVSAGTLGGSGTITGPVVVVGGATFSPGASIGTLTINNALSLAAGSTTVLEVNKTDATSDLVTGTGLSITNGGTLVLKNLSGALQVGDTFTVYGPGTYTGSFSSVVSQTPNQTVTWDVSQLNSGGNGTIKVATAVAAPVTLAPVVSGSTFNLAWPADQIGWQLQSQVNALAIGLSNNWAAVPGSTLTNQVSLPLHSTEPTEFFRLVFPAQ